MSLRYFIFVFISSFIILGCDGKAQDTQNASSPRIVNIINFIRQVEPRYDGAFPDEYLYQTVVNQIAQLNEYQLPGTFLLQYDALINPLYQTLLKENLSSGSEVGAWWEITQPHVEAAGLEWRGRYPWDWHADIGFATGYSPKEREKLIDVYMEKFKSIFGKYPSSVGSWFIDAHSLGYMYDKYQITASCNCKDQIGTDGYTLWGGYWNQAYYPSRKNAYMPAQNKEAQIPVPIFRMLGSDPMYQYDNGVGGMTQGVISLEPVYRRAGGDEKWVRWFFNSIFEDPALNFNYTQAGQENSFGWNAMERGLNIQIPILDSLRKENKIRVESLETSGKWFRENYEVTPPTSLTTLTDIQDRGNKTVWFNSRYYRANLFWQDQTLRFRDIHLFDERLASDYVDKAGTSNQCIYTTLPVVDGFLWSSRRERAGLRFMTQNANGEITELKMGDPIVSERGNSMYIEMNAEGAENAKFNLKFSEDKFTIACDKNIKWFLELKTAEGKTLPFKSIGKKEIKAVQSNFEYSFVCEKGSIESSENSEYVFRIQPYKKEIAFNCKNN